MSEIYYLDACIWLNLLQKEKEFWKIAKEFIERTQESDEKIIVSTIVLKELFFKLENKFSLVNKFFQETSYIKIIKTTNEDYNLAREFERTEKIKISFYDYLHIAICQRLNIILITRDKDLILVAKNHIRVYKPEDLVG